MMALVHFFYCDAIRLLTHQMHKYCYYDFSMLILSCCYCYCYDSTAMFLLLYFFTIKAMLILTHFYYYATSAALLCKYSYTMCKSISILLRLCLHCCDDADTDAPPPICWCCYAVLMLRQYFCCYTDMLLLLYCLCYTTMRHIGCCPCFCCCIYGFHSNLSSIYWSLKWWWWVCRFVEFMMELY